MEDPAIETWRQTSNFKTLLNPIRDITASWGIDIAKQLCQYAASIGIQLPDDELEDTSTSPPQTSASSTVDFAQAALIVQGSTFIYSRKIEHLYSLVYAAVSTLNQLSGGSGNGNRGNGNAFGNESASGEDNDEDDDNDDGFNIDEVDFITLDDDIQPADPRTIQLQSETLPPQGSLLDTTCLRPVPPMLRQNTSPPDMGNVDRANFKMRTAVTHPSGALLTEGCPAVDENLDIAPPRLTATLPPPCIANDSRCNKSGFNMFQGATDEDDNASLVPPAFEECDDNGPPPFSSQTGESLEAHVVTPQQAPPPTLLEMPLQPSRDPFALLDPHEERPLLNKPLRTGKTFRKARILEQKGKSLLVPVAREEDASALIEAIVGRLPQNATLSSYVCTAAARTPFRALVRRRRARTRVLMMSFEGAEDDFAHDGEDSECDVQVTRGAGNGLNDSSVNGGPSDDPLLFDEEGDDLAFDMNHSDSHAGGEDANPLRPSLHISASNGMAGHVGHLYGSEMITDATSGADNVSVDDNLRILASNYAQTCQKYLAETAWMWEKRVIDSNLTKRVEAWTHRIHPILEEEEQRKEFDIRECGEVIVNRMRRIYEDNPGITTARMSMALEGEAKFEVCRYFLASLQLANQDSIEIIQDNECRVSDPMLRLVVMEGGKTFETPLARTKRKRQMDSTPVNDRPKPFRQRLDIGIS